jgi:glycosyltransferase involved in cell wall biosynthesis
VLRPPQATDADSTGVTAPGDGLDTTPLHLSATPMKITILGSRGFPSTYGGSETLVRYLARGLVRRGHAVTVYCRQTTNRRRAWNADGVRCVWTPGYDSKWGSTLSYGLTSHAHAAARVGAQRFDVALVLNVANGYYLPLLSARGIPTVVNTDGLEWERGKWGPAARKVFYRGAALTARYADVLVSDSEAIAEVWNDEFDIRPRFIPYGGVVRDGTTHARITELGLASRGYILSVARLNPENNVGLTLDALERMADPSPAVIVGSANYRSPIEARLRELHARGRIRWLGHVHNQELLGELWANAGVYIHGHSVGGTNPALLQALGLGAPTLALDTPFNREVIRREEQLYPHDPQVLADRIGAILDNPARQNEWASHGRETVAARYCWGAVCDSYERALHDAAVAKRQP